MKKVYKLDEIDCANCAAKLEDAIRRIDGVNNVSVSFITQKLTLEADDARYDAVLEQTLKVCKKLEPDCRVLVK